jgi:hypothetical protein
MNGSHGFVEFRLNQLVEAEILVLEHALPKISFDGGASAIKDFRVMVCNMNIFFMNWIQNFLPFWFESMDINIRTESLFNFHWQAWSSATVNGAGSKGTELITGQYLLNKSISDTFMPHVQKFILSKHKIDHLRLEILTNHGNVGYTCVYKVKLFGKVAWYEK